MNLVLFVVAAAVFDLVLCEPPVFGKVMTDLAGYAEKVIPGRAGKSLSEGVEQLSDRIGDIGSKVKEAMDDILEEDLSEETSTEFTGIDATGCNRGYRKEMEEKCDAQYEKINDEAQQLKGDREKTEAICCALEDFEKCSLRAYDKANCATDKDAIKENLKAARLFLSVVGNITCTEFRGQCAFYSSASMDYTISYVAVFLSSLFSLLMFLV